MRTTIALLAVCLLWGAAHAEITLTSYLDVHILMDNSGSMYPGYRLPDEGGTPKSVSGVGFFHEYPEFREWLKKLIAHQARLNAENVTLSTFTTGKGENIIDRILGPIRYEEITHQKITDAFEKLRQPDGKFKWGQITELRDNLQNKSKGFEGIVWLITDNIIQTSRDTHDYQDILNFFETLRDESHYKSVHLYKYPFQDVEKGQESNLAIYGMLVSPEPTNPNVIAYFDDKFRSMASLFPGNEHRQLKDPRINPIALEAPIKVDVLNKDSGLFKTTQVVRLNIEGNIKSNLTHHTITSGQCQVAVDGPFAADPQAVKDYGVPPGISSNKFRKITRPISRIPPEGSQSIIAELTSNQQFTLETSGILAFIKSALGMKVSYNGFVRLDVYNLEVNFERESLAGIYGIDAASDVFDFQDFKTIKNVAPHRGKASFTLAGGGTPALLLILFLLLLALGMGFMGWFLFGQKEKCEIGVDENIKPIQFRRMGGHDVTFQNQNMVRVSRGIGKDFSVKPNVPGMTIKPRKGNPGVFDVRSKSYSFVLSVKPLSGGNVSSVEGSAEKAPALGSKKVFTPTGKGIKTPGGERKPVLPGAKASPEPNKSPQGEDAPKTETIKRPSGPPKTPGKRHKF